MKVVEKFISINGEGVRAGELAVFLRFKGCNLRCTYCDTMWANEPDCSYTEETPEELLDYVLSTGIHNVTLTGGEPLLQKEIRELIALLLGTGKIRVEIETNGAVSLEPFCSPAACHLEDGLADMDASCKTVKDTTCADTVMTDMRPVFTMDYKLPSSGCEKMMLPENFALLKDEDTVKFVSGSEKDLERAYEIICEYDLLSRCHVYFSPVFGSIEPEAMVNFMIRHKLNEARLQIQIHKVIWDPDKRGV